MNIRGLSLTLVLVFLVFSTLGCQLNPQKSKEKTAFNNFMSEIKATNYLDGKVGNINYGGNEFTFNFTDPNLKKEEMEDICIKLLTYYANANNRAQTGTTVLKIYGKSSQGTVKAVYQAGPSRGDDIRENVKITWE